MLICNNFYELPDKTIVGGDYKELYWKLKDMEHGGFLDCKNLKMTFSLTEYSNRSQYPAIEKECVVIENPDGSNEFMAMLESNDTQNLFGEYVYQITVIINEQKQQSFQGLFHILKNVNNKPKEII